MERSIVRVNFPVNNHPVCTLFVDLSSSRTTNQFEPCNIRSKKYFVRPMFTQAALDACTFVLKMFVC